MDAACVPADQSTPDTFDVNFFSKHFFQIFFQKSNPIMRIGKAAAHRTMKVCIDCLWNTLKMVQGEKII